MGRVSPPTTVFYDGTCSLCTRIVHGLASEDRCGTRFRFGTLQGRLFEESMSRRFHEPLPDTIVVVTGDGRVRMRSRGVLHVLQRLGGLWAAVSYTACLIPTSWLDRVYDAIAKRRTTARHLPTAPSAAAESASAGTTAAAPTASAAACTATPTARPTARGAPRTLHARCGVERIAD